MVEQKKVSEYQFRVKCDNWVALPGCADAGFTDDEKAQYLRSTRFLRAGKRTVVLLAFENTIASLGGLAAVLRRLPASLAGQGERVIMLTPLHTGATKVRNARDKKVLVRRKTGIRINMCKFRSIADCYEDIGAAVPTYHISMHGRFCAGDNPYGYTDQHMLLVDSLAFCAAVPAVLAALGISDRILFHGHDWEAAPMALFSRYAVISGVLQSAATVLTLHNLFDAPLSQEVQRVFFRKPFTDHTVLQVMLPLVNGPLTTVSTPYAHELTNDPLQRGVFADHLQSHFRCNPPIGIENGMFGMPENPFPQIMLHKARRGTFISLSEQKQRWKTDLLDAIRTSEERRVTGTLSDTVSAGAAEPPLLFMSGRYDLTQKGFDVIFQAMRQLPRGCVKLFFSPTPNNNSDDFSFFTEIAEECQGDITIWPFRIDSTLYNTCLLGSSFLVMPSLYEPFGAASEGLLHGTPLIARATGGLLSQLVPENPDVIPQMHRMLFPPKTTLAANSILYRETFDDGAAEKSWREVLNAAPEHRMEFPLYVAMVEAARDALVRAASLYADPQRYGRMVFSGLESVQGASWKYAAGKYTQVYDAAQFRS